MQAHGPACKLMKLHLFWNFFEYSGSFWNILEHSETLWNTLEHSGTFWNCTDLDTVKEFQLGTQTRRQTDRRTDIRTY